MKSYAIAKFSLNPKKGDLRVWWIPQIPMDPFYVFVNTPEEAVLLIDAFAKYDLFQFKNNIKPDYCNAGGLQVFDEEGDWSEWCGNEDEDPEDIHEYSERLAESSE